MFFSCFNAVINLFVALLKHSMWSVLCYFLKFSLTNVFKKNVQWIVRKRRNAVSFNCINRLRWTTLTFSIERLKGWVGVKANVFLHQISWYTLYWVCKKLLFLKIHQHSKFAWFSSVWKNKEIQHNFFIMHPFTEYYSYISYVLHIFNMVNTLLPHSFTEDDLK